MLFILNTLNLAKFFSKQVLKLLENKYDPNVVEIMNAWNHNDYV